MDDLNTNSRDEMTLKEIIIALSLYKKYLFSKWKVIFIAGLIGATLGLTYSLLSKKVYKAELTFALEDNAGDQMGSYAMIASQFGMNLGGGENGVFSGDNIMELMKSRLLIENTLLSPVVIEGNRDLLINRYIEFNELRAKWQDDPSLVNLKYITGQPRAEFSLEQDSVLCKVYEKIQKKYLTVEKVDKQLNIVKVALESKDELFAKRFIEVLAKNVSDFYIETKTKKSRTNVNIIQNKVDSVKATLDAEMYSAAVSQDMNQNQVYAQARIPRVKREMNLQILTTMYGELLKNLELSKLTLMKEEPLIQVIDSPILPLKFTKPGKIISVIVGGVIGSFLYVIYLIIRRVYKLIMNE